MKKLFILSLVALAFLGCKKEKAPDPFVTQFQKIIEKYLICDSIRTITGGVSFVQAIGKGRGEDLMFHGDATFTKYSSPALNRIYQLEPPKKIYYYDYDAEVDNNIYFLVDSISDKNLFLRKTDSIGNYTLKYLRVE